MSKRILLIGALLAAGLLLIAACTEGQRAAIQTAAAVPPGDAVAVRPTETPRFSALVTPTPLPTVGGMLGTWTAVAQVMVIPTQDAEPYVITNQGRPHFVEFHALW